MYDKTPSYYRQAQRDLLDTVDKCLRVLSEASVEFDTIAVMGISGMLVGPTLAAFTGTNLVVIPKSDEGWSHRGSSHGPVGTIALHWIFVDDFICSGETRRRVREAIHKVCPDAIEVGTLEYNRSWSSPSFTPVRPY